MIKIFRLSFLTFLAANIYFTAAFAQELPDDPPMEPPIDAPPSEPSEPVHLVPVKLDLNDADSKELFDVLNKWNLVVIDRQTQIKKIQTSEIVCVENMEDGRQLGCTVYDDLKSRDVTKYNKNADPLFKVLVKHLPMDCEDDSETCILDAEKMNCTLAEQKYLCSIEALVPETQKKKGDSK